jgi:transposase
MIPHGVEVFVGLDLIDLRWGFNRLTGLVAERLGRDARSGALFVFIGKQREAMKILFSDGSGVCLFYKRLDKGRFRLPVALTESAAAMEISERELDDLLDGIDLEPAATKMRSTRH